MNRQLATIALIGVLLLSGCSMFGNGNDVAQPTEQPTTETTTVVETSTHEQQVVMTADGAIGTTTTERTDDVVTQPPDSAPEDGDAADSKSDSTSTPTEAPVTDTETETESPTKAPDTYTESLTDVPDDDSSNDGENGTDTNNSDESDNSTNESETIPDNGTVEEVHTGNIITVEFDDGTQETIRLLGVDVPAMDVNDTDPEKWGFNDTLENRQYMAHIGANAQTDTYNKINGDTVEIMTDEETVRRDSQGRVLAYVRYDGGMSINRQLLERGYARAYDADMPYVMSGSFGEIESITRHDGDGVWSLK